MILNFRKMGEGPALVILHGVFGSADNWQSLGKVFAKNFTVYLVDQRNHGLSFHSDEFNYEVMTRDLLELCESEGLKKIKLMGHSMGGKTAMHFACLHSEIVDKLAVVDISPRAYPPHHHQIFAGFQSVDLTSLTSRKDADVQMSKEIGNMGIRQFILKNLRRDGDSWGWKLNLKAIEKNASQIGMALPAAFKYDGETIFIAGSNSDYIKEADHDLIRDHFPNATVKVIEGAGHWVHAEKPMDLEEMVTDFLK